METHNNDFDSVLKLFVANSLFTARQIDIILKRKKGNAPIENISSGAYYRQIKQCKNKITKLYYSIILLSIVDIIDLNTIVSLSKIAEQIKVLKTYDNSDSSQTLRVTEVMSVINKIIITMSTFR
jgi:hypothetical protein